jgi:hypothetical protein
MRSFLDDFFICVLVVDRYPLILVESVRPRIE